MSRRRIHQVLVGAGVGDAITTMAMALRTGLRSRGESEIYAQHLPPALVHEIAPLREFDDGRRGDVIVYHASFGDPDVTRFLLSRREPIVLVYHNITPSEFFVRHQPHFASGLEWGRHELRLLRDRVAASVADSQFNADDLRSMGWGEIEVVPAGLRPSRLTGTAPSPILVRELAERFPHGYVLSVSQLLPHKRFETTIAAMHLVQWVHELKLGLVIAGPDRLPDYSKALRHHAAVLRLRDPLFTGALSDARLAAVFRMATMFVTTSAHEGLAVPPLEAMSFGVPVVARDAGALRETIAGGGLVLPPDAGPMLISEAIAAVATDPALHAGLRARGFRRAGEVEATDPSERFLRVVDRVL